MISETKLDESFPVSQFLMPGFENSIRLDRSSAGAAIERYKRHPSNLKIKKQTRIENYFDFKHIDDKKWQKYSKI